ncbi:MAG: PA0069 family radical SAM protein [Pseudomonadota bacterium]
MADFQAPQERSVTTILSSAVTPGQSRGQRDNARALMRGGRGATFQPTAKYEKYQRVSELEALAEDAPSLRTNVTVERAKSILTENDSPDLSFDQSVNPYRGCEHGCVYCFARPSHANMGLSPGLDFETQLFAKPEAAKLLERELARPGYEAKTIAIGTNTDPYQPIERKYLITRQILEVCDRTGHPIAIVTKSALVTRDIDILASLAERGLVKVALSVTTLDPMLARAMEPRTSQPEKRIQALELLEAAGIPTSVLVAPIIPALNEHEIEAILGCVSLTGSKEAGYVLLRLPWEVKDLFERWLEKHYPDRAKKVMSIMKSMRGGSAYDSTFFRRQTGTGPHAWTIGRRFEIAARKFGFNDEKTVLRTDLFEAPVPEGGQMRLI